MATKIARADGVINTAATWGAVDATSLLDSEAANTVLTTAYVESATFTPGAITIDGIAVKIRSRSASPSGTFSIRLAQAGATVAGTETIVNVSDISTDQVDQAGWFLAKFAAPVLLVAATLYTVSSKTSVAAMVTLYRDATAGNWSRMLRTTTTGAPAAGDNCFILGEWTAGGTKTNRAVTIDTTAATDYGAASTTLAGWGVSSGGTLVAGVTAATTYILQLSARLVIWYGGILNTGTAGAKMPRDSKLTIQFDCAADGDFGLTCYGTHIGRGQSRTSGKDVVRCLLTTDLAAAATTLNVDTDTGWLNGDDIVLAPTGTNTAQAEARTLNAGAGASSMTISAGLTNAHLGTSPRQAEVILMTRNVVIRAVTAGLTAYVYYGSQSTCDLEWHEFRYHGSGTNGKRGIEFDTTTGSAILNYCSHRDFDQNGLYMTASAWNNITITNHVAYQTSTTSGGALRLGATTASNWTITDCCFIGNTSSSVSAIDVGSARGTLARIRISGWQGSGIVQSAAFDVGWPGWTGFEIHSCVNGINFVVGNLKDFGSLLVSNFWANTVGLNFGSSGGASAFLVENCNFFGNSDNVIFATTPANATFRTCTFASTAAVASARGIKLNQANSYYRLRCENCTFGVASGIKQAHVTGDIDFVNTTWVELTLVNTNLASATEIANQTNALGQSFIAYERVDQATNTHKTVWPAKGTVAYETTVFKTAAPSEKLTPSGATSTFKLTTSIKRARIANGATVSVSAYVRKDGTYTGNPPRLMERANPAIGINADVVLATFSAAADVWQQLTGTSAAATENGVIEFYVDCDGSAGNIYVDDWQAA